MTLAIYDALAVELRNTRDSLAGGILGGIKVYYFEGGALEGEDDGVGGENGEVGMEFLKLSAKDIYRKERRDTRT